MGVDVRKRWMVLLAILALVLVTGAAQAPVPDRGYLGVELEEEAESSKGAMIHNIEKGSPAAKAGLVKGHRIVEVDGKQITNSMQLIELLKKSSAGQTLRLGVENPDGWLKFFDVTLAGREVETPKPARPYLGVRIEDTEKGLRVAEVLPGTPAAKAGLKGGDLIVRANGKPIRGQEDFGRLMSGLAPGSRLDLEILRTKPIQVTLGGREEEPPSPAGKTEEVKEKPVEKRPGWIGVRLEPMGEKGRLKILSVLPDSPAKDAGVEAGDILLKIAGMEITGFDSLGAALKKFPAGSRTILVVDRGGKRKELPITIGERP